MAAGEGAQLTIFWKQDNPPQTVKQVLKPSDVVYVDIMSEFDMNMKKMKLTVRRIFPQLSTPVLLGLGTTKTPERRKIDNISESLFK